jgi:hypothetical protein
MTGAQQRQQRAVTTGCVTLDTSSESAWQERVEGAASTGGHWGLTIAVLAALIPTS